MNTDFVEINNKVNVSNKTFGMIGTLSNDEKELPVLKTVFGLQKPKVCIELLQKQNKFLEYRIQELKVKLQTNKRILNRQNNKVKKLIIFNNNNVDLFKIYTLFFLSITFYVSLLSIFNSLYFILK